MTVELLEWTHGNRAALAALCNGVDRRFLSDRLPHPYTEADADRWLERIRHDGGGLYRAVCVDGVPAGTVSAERKGDVYAHDAELGYMLADGYRGRGVMTEAVRQFCPLAFAALGLLRLTALVYAPNAASRRVLQKNGFAQEGLLRRAVVKDGNIYDLCVFGKLRDAAAPSCLGA